jgi:hypothetical protein
VVTASAKDISDAEYTQGILGFGEDLHFQNQRKEKREKRKEKRSKSNLEIHVFDFGCSFPLDPKMHLLDPIPAPSGQDRFLILTMHLPGRIASWPYTSTFRAWAADGRDRLFNLSSFLSLFGFFTSSR